MVVSVQSFPDRKFLSTQWGFMSMDGVFQNSFNGQVQTVDLGGAFWQASFQLVGMKGDGAQFAAWKAFFASLGGRSGRFWAYDPDRRIPLGSVGGTPLVNGANQTGNLIPIDGCSNNITGWLKGGDYISINGEYKMITADVNTDGSGNAILPIFPQMRQAAPDNTAIVTTNPLCLMMLDNPNLQWQSNNAKVTDLSFTAREAFDFTTYLLTEGGDNLITEGGDYLVI